MKRHAVVGLATFIILVNACAQFLQVDPEFAPEKDGTVTAIGIQPDGKIVIGGFFTNVAGVARPRLARLNPNGTLDESFVVTNQLGGYVSRVFPTSTHIYASFFDNKGIRKVTLDGQLAGTYYAGPAFAIDSQQRLVYGVKNEVYAYDRVGRFNEGGSRDSSFSIFVGCCHNMGVNAVAIQTADGAEKILLGGYFTEVGTNQYFGLARLNEDSSVDTNFVGGSSYEVNLLQVWNDGKFYTATDHSIERRFPDGSIDPSFAPMPSKAGSHFFAFGVQVNGSVVALERSESQESFLVGSLPGGSIDTNLSAKVDGDIRALAVQPDGAVIIGGTFTNVNCIRRTYLARLILSTTPDPLPCVPPPPEPEPWIETTTLPKRQIAVTWQAGYPEYALEAARRLRPRHPEKEKWVTVTNAPVCDELGCSITNKISRYGKHYRLVKP